MKKKRIQRKFSLNTIVLASMITGITVSAIAFGLGRHFPGKKKTVSVETSHPANTAIPGIRNVRLRSFHLTQPLLMAELPDESAELEDLRSQFTGTIRKAEAGNKINSAAVYLHDLSNGHWIGVNKWEQYDPGSILKLTILLAYLRKSEDQPGLMDRRIYFDRPFTSVPYQSIKGETITPGRSYPIRELIRYMLVESDNQANALLNNNIEPTYALNVFSDLQLPVPKTDAPSLTLNCVDVSRFLRLLFNASYTNPSLSEFALEQLTQVRYADGIRSTFPAGVTIAHKFGERGYANSNQKELHETALIYLEDRVILLTIMTKGNDLTSQAELIRNISMVVARRYSSIS